MISTAEPRSKRGDYPLIASTGLLSADYFQLSYVKSLPGWVLGVTFILLVLSGSVLTVSLIRWVIEAIEKPIRRKRRARWEAEHVAAINELPNDEGYILAWAVANQMQVFSAPYFNADIKALMAKGYLFNVPGSHAAHQVPFMIPEYIWRYLKQSCEGEDMSRFVGQRPFSRW